MHMLIYYQFLHLFQFPWCACWIPLHTCSAEDEASLCCFCCCCFVLFLFVLLIILFIYISNYFSLHRGSNSYNLYASFFPLSWMLTPSYPTSDTKHSPFIFISCLSSFICENHHQSCLSCIYLSLTITKLLWLTSYQASNLNIISISQILQKSYIPNRQCSLLFLVC
ncbi:mCG147851 [Mus musculus]|nr:mCG147851 [Mus musculus]